MEIDHVNDLNKKRRVEEDDENNDIWKPHREFVMQEISESDLKWESHHFNCDFCRKPLYYWKFENDETDNENDFDDENNENEKETGFYKSTKIYQFDICQTCFNEPHMKCKEFLKECDTTRNPTKCKFCEKVNDKSFALWTSSGNENFCFGDCCIDNPEIVNFLKTDLVFIPFDIQKTGDFFISTRTGACFMDVRKNKKGYEIPFQLLCVDKNSRTELQEITKETNQNYLDNFESVVHTNLLDSHLNWTSFTKESDQFHFNSCLLVNCEKGGKHPVASMLFDNHGRISIDRLYDSFDEFWSEFNEWLESRTVKEPKKEKEKEEEEESEEKEIETFSDFIRIKRDLECYYG